MTIQEAAKQLRLSEQLLRVWIQNGCPFGEVIRKKNNRYGKNTYYVNEERLHMFIEGRL